MAEINKDMKVGEILALDSKMAGVFIKHGMHCIGCPSASTESIEDACIVHGIDKGKLLEDLNKNEYL